MSSSFSFFSVFIPLTETLGKGYSRESKYFKKFLSFVIETPRQSIIFRQMHQSLKYLFVPAQGEAYLALFKNVKRFDEIGNQFQQQTKLYTIAWNPCSEQEVIVDNVCYTMPRCSILPIMMSQSFEFEKPENIILWQFNREFYCVVDHDAEVSCVGFVFYGPQPVMFVTFDELQTRKMAQLVTFFEEEFESEEDIKAEMLRALLVRLIIEITRTAKKQYLPIEGIKDSKLGVIRQYNLLVEKHYKREHKVTFYANKLNKSPKTIANLFTQISDKTPLQIIHERIVSEAKRFFMYSDKSVKEVADALGFDDVAHFSKLYKKMTSVSPSESRKLYDT